MKRVTLARNRDVVHATVEITSLWTECKINLTQRAFEEAPQATTLPISCRRCQGRMGIGTELELTFRSRTAAA